VRAAQLPILIQGGGLLVLGTTTEYEIPRDWLRREGLALIIDPESRSFGRPKSESRRKMNYLWPSLCTISVVSVPAMTALGRPQSRSTAADRQAMWTSCPSSTSLMECRAMLLKPEDKPCMDHASGSCTGRFRGEAD